MKAEYHGYGWNIPLGELRERTSLTYINATLTDTGNIRIEARRQDHEGQHVLTKDFPLYLLEHLDQVEINALKELAHGFVKQKQMEDLQK